MEGKKIMIARMFPNVLYLHGDVNNADALVRASRAAGLSAEVRNIGFDSADFRPADYDVILFPAGEMNSFPTLLEWLAPHREALAEFVAKGKVLLATGTSQVMFGGRTERTDGSAIEGLAITDCTFKEKTSVYGDDLWFTAAYGGESFECVAMQIQMMDVETKEKSFGELKYGYGNSGQDRREGAVKGNSIFTNALGPLLVLCPRLTKRIIELCAENAGLSLAPFEIDDELERRSAESKKRYILSKKKVLNNCSL